MDSVNEGFEGVRKGMDSISIDVEVMQGEIANATKAVDGVRKDAHTLKVNPKP